MILFFIYKTDILHLRTVKKIMNNICYKTLYKIKTNAAKSPQFV